MPELTSMPGPTNALERLLLRYLTYWHGQGEAWQHDYYECGGCKRLVTHKQIRAGGCRCGLANVLRPKYLRWWHKARLLLFPWSV